MIQNDIRGQLMAEVFINASIEKVWNLWTDPNHIAKWNNISDEWHTPKAENELRVGGKLFLRMELKDGSDGFDYVCFYDDIIVNLKKLVIPVLTIEKQRYSFLLLTMV